MLPFLFVNISLKYIFEMVCLIQVLQLHVQLQDRFRFLFSGCISYLYNIFTFCYIYLPTHMLPYWAIMCCSTVGIIILSLLPRNKLLQAVQSVYIIMLCFVSAVITSRSVMWFIYGYSHSQFITWKNILSGFTVHKRSA